MDRVTIVTDKDELRIILRDILKEILPKQENTTLVKRETDIVDIQGLVAYLAEIGIKTSKNYVQQLALNRKIPYMEFDDKLLFSKKEVMGTITANKVMPLSENDSLNELVHRMRKKDIDTFF